MTKQPHDYQLLGAARIHFLCESPFEGCMLGDEPGLGKTLEAILAMYLCREDMGMCLVVCPASLCQHWVDSVNRAFTTVSARPTLLPNSTISRPSILVICGPVGVC